MCPATPIPDDFVQPSKHAWVFETAQRSREKYQNIPLLFILVDGDD